jgi:hypothetical protein
LADTHRQSSQRTIHAGAALIEQDRSRFAAGGGAVDRAGDGRWHRDENNPVTLPDDADHAVAMFLAQVADVQAGRFKDPQPEGTEQADQRKVVAVR